MSRPTEIRLRRQSRLLVIRFDDDKTFELPFELLRVYSPSAEVRGHGEGQRILQVGKKHVNISAIEPVGNYGVRLTFDDGHLDTVAQLDIARGVDGRSAVARAALIAGLGADAVLGSHPHHRQFQDVLTGCPVVFSLGNLAFDGGRRDHEFNTGWLAEISLTAAGSIVAVKTIPVSLDAAGHPGAIPR